MMYVYMYVYMCICAYLVVVHDGDELKVLETLCATTKGAILARGAPLVEAVAVDPLCRPLAGTGRNHVLASAFVIQTDAALVPVISRHDLLCGWVCTTNSSHSGTAWSVPTCLFCKFIDFRVARRREQEKAPTPSRAEGGGRQKSYTCARMRHKPINIQYNEECKVSE
jgi:hypothetical protein